MCPVCGYGELDEKPWDQDLNPSWDICPSCGTHFGNYDFGTTSAEVNQRHLILRKQWIDGGCMWHSSFTSSPQNWNPQEQLKKISLEGEVNG